jgi:hypothetical protein
MNFLPDGFEKLKTQKPYWKMSEMKEGDNKLRIVCKPIAGWIEWVDKKPMRYRPDQKPKKSFDLEKPIKPFWVCYVWDYAREGLFILEITQSSIIRSLTGFATDEDWGDFTKYDLKLKKEGTGKETKYSITPLPHKELFVKIKEALSVSPVRLESLYDGGDPWVDLDDSSEQEAVIENKTFSSPMEELKEYIKTQGMDDSYVEEYVKSLAEKKKRTVEEVVTGALLPVSLPKFKEFYAKELASKSIPVAVNA